MQEEQGGTIYKISKEQIEQADVVIIAKTFRYDRF